MLKHTTTLSYFLLKCASIGAFCVFFCHVLPATAWAERVHPLVQEGHAFYEQAQFAQALEAFEKAAAADGLSKQDVIKLLEGRALVNFAMGQKRATERSLAQLASVAPEHRFDATVPPEVVVGFTNALKRSQGTIRIGIKRESIFGGELLQAQLWRDVGALVRKIRIVARSSSGKWSEGDGVLRIQAPRFAEVEYYAVAVGPGGAPIAELASPNKPEMFSVGVADIIPPASLRPQPVDNCVHPLVWMGIGAAVGALIVGAVWLIVNETSDDGASSPAALLEMRP